jgi:hypothetical protein
MMRIDGRLENERKEEEVVMIQQVMEPATYKGSSDPLLYATEAGESRCTDADRLKAPTGAISEAD